MVMKSYSEMIELQTFRERYEYLKFDDGEVGVETFGFNRYLNQSLYSRSQEWKQTRRKIILRDSDLNYCFDLGSRDRIITGRIIIHHINPITKDDILNRSDCLFDPDNLVCCGFNTHNAIHYGDYTLLDFGSVTRKKGDTKLW